MTTTTDSFVAADTAEILEAAGWDVWSYPTSTGTAYSGGDQSGNRATVYQMSDTAIATMELATDQAPYDVESVARIATRTPSAAERLARMILAAAQSDDD
jgi:hypothetical protein